MAVNLTDTKNRATPGVVPGFHGLYQIKLSFEGTTGIFEGSLLHFDNTNYGIAQVSRLQTH